MKIEALKISTDCVSLKVAQRDINTEGGFVYVNLEHPGETEPLANALLDEGWKESEIVKRLDRIHAGAGLMERFCQWVWVRGF